MPDTESTREFHNKLIAGSESAAGKLDRRYRKRLCDLVRDEMDRRLRRKEDPEDVVQSALRTFFRRANKGEFQIDCSAALWKLLEKITRRKILKHVEYLRAAKRDPNAEIPSGGDPSDDYTARTTMPDEAAAVVDTIEAVLEGLELPYPEILELRLEGCTIAETAQRIGCTPGAVRYKLERLQERFGRLAGQDCEK